MVTQDIGANGAEGSPHVFLDSVPATAVTQVEAAADSAVDMRSLPPSPVTNLDIDVTEACNLACSYCFKGELYSKHMDPEMLKNCYYWLAAASHGERDINFNFMGGEPTMRWKQIRAFAPWARQRGRLEGKMVTFSMTSNLTLWTDEIRDFVDEFGFGVLMSIDGCPEVQDAQRPAKNGKAMSAVVERWAKSMLRTRPGSTARMTLSPRFVHRFADSVRYLHEIGFTDVTVGTAAYQDWTEKDFTEFDTQLDQVISLILQGYLAGKPINLTVFKYQISAVIRHRKSGASEKVVWHKQPCGAGKGYMMIDYTGDIWPCHRFDGADADIGAGGAFRLGNITRPGFHTELQKSFTGFDHSQFRKPSCDSCPCDPTCAGFCPAANLADTGSIHSPHDGYCRLSQMQYAAAERLYDQASEAGVLDAILVDASGTHGDGR